MSLPIFDPSLLVLDRDGIESIGEIIFKEKFVSPNWSQFMDTQQGIKANKQILISDNFNGLAGSVRSACDITPNPYQIASTEKTWTPQYVSDRFEDCFDNLQSSFWKKFLANGKSKEDLSQSDYDSFITDAIRKYMGDDLMYRLLFFTDPAIAAGTGNNLTGGELKYFNMITGIWAQLVTIYGTTAARKTASPSTTKENDGATYVLQAFAAASSTVHPATDWLNAVVYGASIELRGASNPIILVTQSVMDQYVQERKAVTNIELAYTRTETGMQVMEFDGKPMVAIPTFDRLIRRHLDDGTKWTQPHRILYTTKTNIVVGTEEIGNLSELSSDYDRYHKKWYVDFGFNLDVKIKDDNMVQYGV